jgi:hypothetical protein
MTTPPTILDTLALGSLSILEQEKLLLAFNDFIFRGTLLRVITQMDETTRARFSALLADGAPPEAIEAFLKEQVPGADRAVEDTVKSLASDLATVEV